MGRLEQTPFGPDEWSPDSRRPDSPRQTRFVVAFSGGADSLALLHAFARSRESNPAMRLCAVHVDHHLHPESTRWAHRCREVCRRLSVELMVLDADLEAGEAVHADEGAARAARYAAFERILSAGDVLCTAHSRDDHVETVLLNLLRGGGARGLAGIPDRRRLGAGIVARPALGVSRAALHAYACATGLEPIRDPANEDPRFSRVVLRREVIPVLEKRWPGLRSTLARVGGTRPGIRRPARCAGRHRPRAGRRNRRRIARCRGGRGARAGETAQRRRRLVAGPGHRIARRGSNRADCP